ncbi:MAG: hypothetical protein ACYDBJ_17040 [Aggregatilineales bacterium]
MEHTATLEDVIRVIGQLKPEDRTTLFQQIQRIGTEPTTEHVTREMILAEHARRLLAGEFEHAVNLAACRRGRLDEAVKC